MQALKSHGSFPSGLLFNNYEQSFCYENSKSQDRAVELKINDLAVSRRIHFYGNKYRYFKVIISIF